MQAHADASPLLCEVDEMMTGFLAANDVWVAPLIVEWLEADCLFSAIVFHKLRVQKSQLCENFARMTRCER
jgi:hypothetical protein